MEWNLQSLYYPYTQLEKYTGQVAFTPYDVDFHLRSYVKVILQMKLIISFCKLDKVLSYSWSFDLDALNFVRCVRPSKKGNTES